MYWYEALQPCTFRSLVQNPTLFDRDQSALPYNKRLRAYLKSVSIHRIKMVYSSHWLPRKQIMTKDERLPPPFPFTHAAYSFHIFSFNQIAEGPVHPPTKGRETMNTKACCQESYFPFITICSIKFSLVTIVNRLFQVKTL